VGSRTASTAASDACVGLGGGEVADTGSAGEVANEGRSIAGDLKLTGLEGSFGVAEGARSATDTVATVVVALCVGGALCSVVGAVVGHGGAEAMDMDGGSADLSIGVGTRSHAGALMASDLLEGRCREGAEAY